MLLDYNTYHVSSHSGNRGGSVAWGQVCLHWMHSLTVSTCDLTGLQICLVHLSHIPKIQLSLAVVPTRTLMFTSHLECTGTNSITCLLITRWSVCNCPSVFCGFVLKIFCFSLCKLCSRVSLTAQLTASSYFRCFGCTALLIQSSFVAANWSPRHQKDTLLQSVLT